MGPNFSLQGIRVEFFWSSFWKYMGRLRPKAETSRLRPKAEISWLRPMAKAVC